MIEFNTLVDSMNEVVVESLGQQVDFIPLVGSPQTGLWVLFDVEVEYQLDGYQSRTQGNQYTIELPLETLNQAPVKGDVFTISGIDYKVIHIAEDSTDEKWIKIYIKKAP